MTARAVCADRTLRGSKMIAARAAPRRVRRWNANDTECLRERVVARISTQLIAARHELVTVASQPRVPPSLRVRATDEAVVGLTEVTIQHQENANVAPSSLRGPRRARSRRPFLHLRLASSDSS